MIITNMKTSYEKPEVLPPISSSDHNCVLWRPKTKQRPSQFTKHVVRPIKEPGLSEIGKWITSHQWNEMKEAVSTEEKNRRLLQYYTAQNRKTFPIEDGETS